MNKLLLHGQLQNIKITGEFKVRTVAISLHTLNPDARLHDTKDRHPFHILIYVSANDFSDKDAEYIAGAIYVSNCLLIRYYILIHLQIVFFRKIVISHIYYITNTDTSVRGILIPVFINIVINIVLNIIFSAFVVIIH
jgi:hypothetical protein